MPTLTLGSKTLKELQQKFKTGYTITAAGKSKFHVLDPDGEVVHSPRSNAPLTLDNSPLPSERKNIESELKAAGVLQETRTQRRKRETPEEKVAREQRISQQKDAQQIRDKNRSDEGKALHDRLEAVLAPMGGFERPGMQIDVTHVALLLEQQNGNKDRLTIDRLKANAARVAQGHWVEPRYQRVWIRVAEELEQADDPTTRYFDLLRTSRGLPEVPVGGRPRPKRTDWPFEVQLLDVRQLFVDDSYQRPTDWAWVRKTAASYDERLVGTIDVSSRRHERYAVLDGQGRLEASKLVGKTSIWCSVYSDFTVINEAAFFLHKNHDRRTMHPYYTFRAKLAAQDENAIETEKIVQAHGYRLDLSDAQGKKQDVITAVASVEETYRRRRADETSALPPTLALLHDTTFGMPAGQNGILLRGVGHFFATYADEDFDRAKLVEAMIKRQPGYIVGRARSTAGGLAHDYRSTAKNVVRVLRDEYNDLVPRGQKLALKEVVS